MLLLLTANIEACILNLITQIRHLCNTNCYKVSPLLKWSIHHTQWDSNHHSPGTSVITGRSNEPSHHGWFINNTLHVSDQYHKWHHTNLIKIFLFHIKWPCFFSFKLFCYALLKTCPHDVIHKWPLM